MTETVATRFDELYRSARNTARTRFDAARRLLRHARLSQWTIAMLSVALILISLLPASGLQIGLTPSLQTTIQVGLSTLVLVFSLLIGSENYSVRADKAHRCGLELNNLARKLRSYRGMDGDNALYEQYSDHYHEILNQYENHEQIDYLTFTLSERAEYYPRRRDFIPAFLVIYLRYSLGFLLYILLFLLVLVAFWAMLM